MENDKYPHWPEDWALAMNISISCHVEGMDPYAISIIVIKELYDWRQKQNEIEKGSENISKS